MLYRSKKIVFIIAASIVFSGCVVSSRRNLEYKLNAMYMLGRMDQLSGAPCKDFRRVRLKYRFPYWGPEFLECRDKN